MRFHLAAGLFAALCLSATSNAQLPGIKGGGLPGLDLGFKEKSPITTALGDAVTEVAFLDDFNPRHATAMSILRRNADGSFKLFPGQFTFEAQSY
jgi:hypothetical protein